MAKTKNKDRPEGESYCIVHLESFQAQENTNESFKSMKRSLVRAE